MCKNTKLIALLIYSPLEYIFYLRISTTIWPEALKTAIVPVFKNGNKKLTTNYRSISLNSKVDKVFEKIVHRIYKFVIGCNIICKNQHGFLKQGGTKDALSVTVSHLDKTA